MGFPDLADHASPDKFDGPTQPPFRRPLITHLRDHLVLSGGFPHDPRFIHGTRQWFLAVHMFTELHRRHSRHGVRVIGGGHQNRINLLFHLIEHPAKIRIRLGSRMFLVDVPCPPGIHIAQRDQVVPHVVKRIKTAPALSANANARDVQLAVGLVGESQPTVAENQNSGSGGR